MDYQDRPFVEVTAARYGEQRDDIMPIRIVDPIVLANGKGLGYIVDLSAFGIDALVHIRIDDMSNGALCKT